jgi:hypothetical protein
LVNARGRRSPAFLDLCDENLVCASSQADDQAAMSMNKPLPFFVRIPKGTMKAKILIVAAVIGLGVTTVAFGDEIQFVTLPQVVRTAVVRETNIPDYSRVTRVIQDQNGLYEVTVHRNTDNDVLYVEPTGTIVRQHTVALNAAVVPPGQIITKTVTVEEPTVNTFIRSLDQDRFQLIEKKGIKEVYLDKLTGERWRVEVRRVEKD